MSYGTSDTTVTSSTKIEAHNLTTTNASAALQDDRSPATVHTTTPKKRQDQFFCIGDRATSIDGKKDSILQTLWVGSQEP